jgi:hypothetical protein
MCAFKAIYSKNNILFEGDVINIIEPYNIDFNKIATGLSGQVQPLENNINLNVYRCNINTPINELYNLCTKLNKYTFIIIFNDYLCNCNYGNIKISNDDYKKLNLLNIELGDELLITNEKNDLMSNQLVNTLINKINIIDYRNDIKYNMNLLYKIYNRTFYDNIYKSSNYHKLYDLLINKVYNIINCLDIDILNDNDEFSLMNELLYLSKLEDNIIPNLDNPNNLFDYYKKDKIFILLKKIIKFIDDDYTIRNIDIDIDIYKDKKYNLSKDLYCSVITRTNWIDELEYGNITGLLVKIDPKEINKNAYNMDYIPIMDITHTVISLEQILEAYKIFHEEHGTLFDDKIDTSSIISGFGIGNGNCIIPLYINPDHWKLVKIYMEYNNGIIFNRNPLISKKKHTDIYYNILMNMINLTFSDENYNSDKWVQLLFSMLRTVYEISKHDSKIITKFKNNLNFRVECNINKILILMLFNNDDDCIKYVIEEQIRRKMKSIYRDITVLDNIYEFNKKPINDSLLYEYNHNTNEYHLINHDEFKNLICFLEDNIIFSKLITIIHSVISMRSIIKNRYNEIFSGIDDLAGVLSIDTLVHMKEKILNNLIKPINYKLKSILNSKFVSHYNITKRKKFTIKTLYDNNIINNDTQLKTLLIQCIIQRVDKCRKKAIKNKKYYNPFKNSDFIIKNTGLLISSRNIKYYYKLNNNINNYINTINNMQYDSDELVLFLLHIRKTLSMKKKILESITSIKTQETRDIITNIYINNKLPDEYALYNTLLLH